MVSFFLNPQESEYQAAEAGEVRRRKVKLPMARISRVERKVRTRLRVNRLNFKLPILNFKSILNFINFNFKKLSSFVGDGGENHAEFLGFLPVDTTIFFQTLIVGGFG